MGNLDCALNFRDRLEIFDRRQTGWSDPDEAPCSDCLGAGRELV